MARSRSAACENELYELQGDQHNASRLVREQQELVSARRTGYGPWLVFTYIGFEGGSAPWLPIRTPHESGP